MFGVGNVLATTVRIWARNFPRLFALMLVFHVVPLLGWSALHWFDATSDVLDAYYHRPLDQADLHPALSEVVASGGWIASAFLTAAISVLVVGRLRDERTGIGQAIAGAVRRPFSLVACALIVRVLTVGVIAVGVMIVWDRYEYRYGGDAPWIAWSVAWIVLESLVIAVVPALVVERRGPFSALRRGVALARGHRIQVIAIVLIGQLLFVAMHLVIRMALLDMSAGPEAFGRRIALVGYLSFGIGTLLSSLVVTCEVVIYERLRAAKEGPAPSQLHQVFD